MDTLLEQEKKLEVICGKIQDSSPPHKLQNTDSRVTP